VQVVNECVDLASCHDELAQPSRTDQAATATFRTPPLFSRTIHARAVMLPYSGAARGEGGKLSPMDGRTKIM